MSSPTISSLLRNNIRNLTPYSSARDEFMGEASVWLDANESPVALSDLPQGINRYPDPMQRPLRERIGQIKGVPAANIFLGNGSDEAVDLLYRCFCNPGVDTVLHFPPTYGMYSVCANINDVTIINSNLDADFNIDIDDFKRRQRDSTKLVFICNPNNPTGNTQPHATIRAVVEAARGIVVVDEAYIDFCPEETIIGWINQYPNLVVLQTLSKAWGLAGARVGLAFANSEIIKALNKVKFPYNIGKPSIDTALAALSKEDENRQRLQRIFDERITLLGRLRACPGVEHIYPTKANFVLVRVPKPKELYNHLVSKGIVVRDRSTQPGCEGCLRLTIGTPEENRVLIEEMVRYSEM